MNRRWLASTHLLALALTAHADPLNQAAPANATKAAEITTKRLIVNGHDVPSVVVRIDNRLYVSLEDLSSVLNGAVTLKGDDLIVSFGAEGSMPKPSEQGGKGGIRGTLTYFFNSNYGNLPDTGAEVVLVSGKVDVPPTASVIMAGPELTVVGGKKVEAVKATAADGSGNYSLQDVPPGEYTLLLRSKHAKDATQRDIAGKVRAVFLKVESGKTADISEDFGMTVF